MPNRLSNCTPQWLALLIAMRLISPTEAREAQLRAAKQQASDATPEPPPTRRRRRKPD